MQSLGKIHWAEQPLPDNERVFSLIAKGEEKPQENKLRAKTEGSLWYCSFEKGLVPEALKQRWTKYSMLRQAVTEYYKKKKIEVKEE